MMKIAEKTVKSIYFLGCKIVKITKILPTLGKILVKLPKRCYLR